MERDFLRKLAYRNGRNAKREVYKINKKDLLTLYKLWLIENKEVAEGSVPTYMSFIEVLDYYVFVDWQLDNSYEDDYLLQLVNAIRENQEAKAKQIIDGLDDYLTELINQAKNSDTVSKFPHKYYSDLRSGWRKFSKYLLSEQSLSHITKEDTEQQIPSVINFKEWLIEEEGFTPDSASTYSSRVLNIQKMLFDKLKLENVITVVQGTAFKEPEVVETMMINLIDIVEEEVKEGLPITNWKENVAQSSLATIKKYRDFILFIASEYGTNRKWKEVIDQTIEQKDTDLNSVKQLVDKSFGAVKCANHDKLFNIFSLRLRTQERTSLPIKDIIRLLNSNKHDTICSNYSRRWFVDSLEKMLVYTSNDEKHLFKDVESISIREDKSVMVTIKNKGSKQLFTRTRSGEFAPMEAKDLSDISIEHQPAISKFLKDNDEELRILPLSKEKMNRFDESNQDDGEENDYRNAQFLLNIIFDLDFIAKNIQLELMQRNQNVNPGK